MNCIKKRSDQVGIINQILKGNLCIGCGLCVSIAPEKIQVSLDAKGFLRPGLVETLSESEIGAIAGHCPGISINQPTVGDVAAHRVWGPVIASRVGYACDHRARWLGSSGGAVSGLAGFLLEAGYADYVVHVAASRINPLMNEVVISRNLQEVLRGAGSRYAPAAPLENIRQILGVETGRAVFIGKPCDVAGLRSLVAAEPQIKEKLVGCISFFCAGVPSMVGTYAILKQLGVKREEVTSFSYRGRGWPGRATADLRDGRSVGMDYATSWGTILNRHLQFRCKICPDGTGEQADISCADAWQGGRDGYPDFSEGDGRSLLLSRTSLGERWLTSAIRKRFIAADECSIDAISAMQPSQRRRKEGLYARLLAMRVLGRKVPRYEGLRLGECALRRGALEFVRNFLGMAVRVIKRSS